MWEYECSVETAATAAAVWRHWSDVAAWPQWNDGIESITINGPFTITSDFPQVLAALAALAERAED